MMGTIEPGNTPMRPTLLNTSKIALLCATLAAAPALAQNAKVDFAPSPNGFISFSMPSGNIECIYTPPGGSKVYNPLDGGPELSCDRAAPQYARITMTPRRVERVKNPGDQSCCGVDNPLAHGMSWSAGPFTCQSAKTGLTCRRSDGHGFQLSRAKATTF
jgi:hypothetical protein